MCASSPCMVEISSTFGLPALPEVEGLDRPALHGLADDPLLDDGRALGRRAGAWAAAGAAPAAAGGRGRRPSDGALVSGSRDAWARDYAQTAAVR